jgi:hypothetical protein
MPALATITSKRPQRLSVASITPGQPLLIVKPRRGGRYGSWSRTHRLSTVPDEYVGTAPPLPVRQARAVNS